MSFFVTGLPRTRTTWFSNFMTYDGYFCHHEALTQVTSFDKLKYFLNGDGNSDSGIPYFWEEFLTDFDSSPTLIIDRSQESVSMSLDKIGLPDDIIESILFGLEKIKERGNVLVMNYDEIDPVIAWNFLVDSDCNTQRAKMLENMNITTQMNYTNDQTMNMTSLLRMA